MRIESKILAHEVPFSLRVYQKYLPLVDNSYLVAEFDYSFAKQEYEETLNKYSNTSTSLLQDIEVLPFGHKLMIGFNSFIWRIK